MPNSSTCAMWKVHLCDERDARTSNMFTLGKLQLSLRFYTLRTVPLTRKVTKLARRSRDTRERLAGDCLNVIAREGSRALESLISVLARQYNSRVVPRELSSFAREGAISICMPVSYYPACGYPR